LCCRWAAVVTPFHIKDRKVGAGTAPLGTGDTDFATFCASLSRASDGSLISKFLLKFLHQSKNFAFLNFRIFDLKELDRAEIVASLSILRWLKPLYKEGFHCNDEHH